MDPHRSPLASETATARVIAAIDASRRLMPDYWAKCLAQRVKGGAGSSYDLEPGILEQVTFTPEETLERTLRAAEWEAYQHPDVMPGCAAFRAPLPGRYGIVEIASLPPDRIVTLADQKGTGFVEAVVDGSDDVGPRVDFTVAILGFSAGEEVVFTFHPGEPIRPSRLAGGGKVWVSAGQARALGLTYAKLRG